MSIFGKIWGGVKSVGGAIGKIFKSKKTAAIAQSVAALTSTASNDPYNNPTSGQVFGYQATGQQGYYNTSPPQSNWYDFITGQKPLDLNSYVKLPNVNVAPTGSMNILVIGAIALIGFSLLKGRR